MHSGPGRSHCRHIKSSGHPCEANVQLGSEFCFFHDPSAATQRKAARRAGGRERTRKLLLLPNTPPKELRTLTDVIGLLGETVDQVRRGELDLRVANCVGYLSGILLSALEKGQIEERVATLESIVRSQSPVESSEAENYEFSFDAICPIPDQS